MVNINKLLEENRLTHFEYEEEEGRLVYNYESSTFSQIDDYKRLVRVFKENNIKHDDVGMDVIFIEKE